MLKNSQRRLLAGLGCFAGLTALVGCSPVTALNAMAPSGTHAVLADIAYGSGPREKLDVYRPTARAPRNGFPVVVFFYGGSWNSGERADFAFVGEALASRGIVTLVADYRLYPQVRYPDFLRDCAAALAFGLEHATDWGGDPARVFVMGHSAGGYNAAMLALDARWLAGVQHTPQQLAGFIGLAGPYDFLPITNPDAKPVFFHPNYPPGTQPIDYVTVMSPRSFLGAARGDELVNPQRNSVGLATKLRAAGVPVTLKLYDHLSHVLMIGVFGWPLRWLAPVLGDVADFIDAAPAVAAPR